jgi:hypothetical protein
MTLASLVGYNGFYNGFCNDVGCSTPICTECLGYRTVESIQLEEANKYPEWKIKKLV